MKAIEINQLTKFYGDVCGIKELNLSVSEGAFFGFIGPNGAGKSTTIRTLLGLIHADGGSAKIFGRETKDKLTEVLADVGYLPGEVNYYGQMTGRELIDYAAGFYKAPDKGRMNHLANCLDYDLNKPIETLSLGNKKKLGIIQALIHRPKLLIMDEPTGGLDPLMQANFFELLRAERENGTTVFFSSHTLSEVQKYCEEVAVIREGQILETTTVQSLRQKQLKRMLVGIMPEDIVAFKAELGKHRGISNIKNKNTHSIEFDFDGDYKKLFNILSQWEISDFQAEEPSLEEIFMHYYDSKLSIKAGE